MYSYNFFANSHPDVIEQQCHTLSTSLCINFKLQTLEVCLKKITNIKKRKMKEERERERARRERSTWVFQREIKPSVSATQMMEVLVIKVIAVIWFPFRSGAVTAIFFY